MEPSLRRGWRIAIAPAGSPPAPGDVVLLASPSGPPVLHRLVGIEPGDAGLLYHRGDAGGGIGVSPARDLLGIAAAVLAPAVPFPTLDRLDPVLRARFETARRRCTAWILVRRLGRSVGLRRLPVGSARRLLARLLLGPA